MKDVKVLNSKEAKTVKGGRPKDLNQKFNDAYAYGNLML